MLLCSSSAEALSLEIVAWQALVELVLGRWKLMTKNLEGIVRSEGGYIAATILLLRAIGFTTCLANVEAAALVPCE